MSLIFSSGVEHGNLRELALERMRDLGLKCRDIRTREVGINEIHNKVRPYDVEPVRRDYVANGGHETFLSYEDPKQDILVGLLRLRQCTKETFRPELQGRCSIIRELHVYGSAVPVHCKDPTKFQHQGFGVLLMEWAEKIALHEHQSEKISVISGVGTRDYYRKLGYELDGAYMSKNLVPEELKKYSVISENIEEIEDGFIEKLPEKNLPKLIYIHETNHKLDNEDILMEINQEINDDKLKPIISKLKPILDSEKYSHLKIKIKNSLNDCSSRNERKKWRQEERTRLLKRMEESKLQNELQQKHDRRRFQKT